MEPDISSPVIDPRMLSLRAKLTLWYLLATFAGMVLFGIISYSVLHYALLREKQSHLVGREERLIHMLEENHAQRVLTPLDEQLRDYALVTHEGNMFQIRRLDGSPLFPSASPDADWSHVDGSSCRERSFQLVPFRGTPAMVMCHEIALSGIPVLLFQGGSLNEELDILRIYRNALLFLLPGLLLLSSFWGYFLSRRAMGPVDRLRKAALSIGVSDLSARVPVPAVHDEVQQLAEAWNQLLGRLEEAVGRLSQFSADVSHDLRTSITIILATAQLALTRDHSDQENRGDLDRIVTECRMAATLLDALLSLEQSKNFSHEVTLRRIDLCELVLNGCRRVEDLAETNGILLDWDLPEKPVFIDGNELLVSRLLGIFLDNAIKYTPESGEIWAEVFAVDQEVGIIVRDTGSGIAEVAQEQIFERFYQADLRERRTQAGHGLGLSIARWIADAHRAKITLTSVPAQGSSFKISFPPSLEAHSSLPVHAATGA
jgi:two-component system, OmpR family, heavy metal sensor histidine kinase CusS